MPPSKVMPSMACFDSRRVLAANQSHEHPYPLLHGGHEMLVRTINDFLGLARTQPQPVQAHLDAVMDWLCRAQDATPDGGVARMYHIKTGWGASYPETTGYIIPTFLEYARLTENRSYVERALRMADWEIEVQMPSGAVQGGTVADPPSPAIFNTGQVIFGWLAAHAAASGR